MGPSWAILAPSWGQPGATLGSSWPLLVDPGRFLAPSWSHLGSQTAARTQKIVDFPEVLKVVALQPCCLDRGLQTVVLAHLALTLGFWRAIWGRLEKILASFWGRLGLAWGSPGRVLACLGALSGHRGAILVPSWRHLGAILGNVGAIMGGLGAILGGFGHPGYSCLEASSLWICLGGTREALTIMQENIETYRIVI